MPATDVEKLVVQLQADIRQYQRQMERAQGITFQRARAIETRFARMSKTLAAQSAALGSGLAKGFAAVGGAATFQGLSDSATKIRNSLSIAGLSGKELEATFDQLYVSAQRNSVPITSLAELYGRVALNQKELGVSSEQLRGLVDNVGKALLVSGADAQSASGALLQLSQALGSNKVQAEEYGSLIDGMPALLQAAANGITQAGGSVSKLTQLVKSGQISNKAFFDGIEAGQKVLDERLSGTTQTVAQRFVVLGNALVKAADRFNRSTGAASALGKEFDTLAGYIDKIDFSDLTKDLGAVIAVLETGAGKAQAFAEWLGKISGLSAVGGAVIDALPGEAVGGRKSYLGGLLTIESSVTEASKLNDLTQKRLSLEKQIADLRAQPQNEDVSRTINKLQGQLNGLPQSGGSPVIQGGPLDYNRFPPPKPERPKVDITDSRYKPADDDGDGKGKKKRLDDYAREIQQIKERTLALNAETDAQAKLNPTVNDYGYAVEFARAKQDLLNAAQEANKKITPELASQIDMLAAGYANAVVASEQLTESQDRIRQKAEEMQEFQKDVTRGIVDGLIQGKKAADVFADALSKVGSKFLDMAFDGIFNTKSNGGSGFNFLSLFGFRAAGGPVKKGMPYIVGEKRPEVFVPEQSGTILPKVPEAPRMPDLSKIVAARQGAAPAITFAPVYNVTGSGPELNQLRNQMAQDKADFPARVLKTMRKAKETRDWK